MDLTNTHIPETVEKSGTKTWDDADNQDGLRPASITVKLLADGIDTGKSATITSESGWTYSFTNLPKYKNSGTIESILGKIKDSINDTNYVCHTISSKHKGTEYISKEEIPGWKRIPHQLLNETHPSSH